ncbi:hypothetical protein GTO89_06810 [Heliobacterium gestii]|uniref:Guanylate cyclase domain-containing protein n=1 Tax=Heliomicrobium gestii TaxID=2699 RepID=A0A845LCU6_HELGE|nr:hypothetical protein [Heliomicrobium gestii]MBM7866466.1 hypothetical protein [Heliomicrobium gestii]MZP42750.1 hypothetical protein [Heliomicrobium gestii]
MRASKYMDVSRKIERYRKRINPLYIIYPNTTITKSIFEQVAINTEDQRFITGIINSEMTEEFKIGGHEDYDLLLSLVTKQEDFETVNEKNVPLCVVYIDLRNFSKRALFAEDPGYETIEEIAALKQRAISTWIKVSRYYQAHIHSITGDGLMILLGGKKEQDLDTWTNGARALLLTLRILESEKMLNDELIQYLKDKGLEQYAINSDNMLDIKVSVDFSPNTLMNPQGVCVCINGEQKPIGEVKATSFHIDICAKMLAYYKQVKERLEGNRKLGRVLLFGEEYKMLMDFNEEKVPINNAGTYSKTMFSTNKSYISYYIDANNFKDNILTLDDVAGICNVFDDSSLSGDVSINIARRAQIQHGE